MTEWRVGRESEILACASPTLVDVEGREVGVFAVGQDLRAYESRCPHQGGPVCRGEVIGRVTASVGDDRAVAGEVFDTSRLQLVCPWHGFEFDLASGACAADARFRLRSYPVRRRDGDVFIVV